MNALPPRGTVALYALTILTGGTSWYAAKFQLSHVAPVVSLIYRFGSASVVLLLICVIAGRRLRFGWREHLVLAVLGSLSFSIAFMLVYKATGLITSGLVALAYSAVVLFNAINASIFLKRPASLSTLMAAMLGLVGIALVFLPEVSGLEWSWAGIGYALAATMAFSFSNIFAVALQKNGIAVLPMTGISMAYGAAFLLCYAWWSGQVFSFDLSLNYVTSLAYLVMFPSVIGYTSYFAVVGRLGPERGAYAMLVVPLVALAISGFAEGYRPTVWAIAGTLMVLGCNLWILMSKSQQGKLKGETQGSDRRAEPPARSGVREQP